MTHIVTSAGFIIVAVVVAFGLTLLATVMIANFKAARQEREGREPPPMHPDDAEFKRGA